MDDFLRQLQRRAGIVTEARIDRYAGMLQPATSFVQGGLESFREPLNWASKTLRRNDRIVWYLRWYRLAAVWMSIQDAERHKPSPLTDPTLLQQAQSYVQKSMKEITTKSNNSEYGVARGLEQIGPGSNAFRNSIQHYLSLNLPTIDRVQFQFQTPYDILNEFSHLEHKWKEKISDEERALGPTEEEYTEPVKLIQFPDGFAWWNLNQAYCQHEGNAMGHCGNRARKTGTILSLRKRIKKGDEQFDVPFCTFILHPNGYLGEMKGRNNKKPINRYHPYIIALLKHSEWIKGIQAGGDEPEGNFSLSDLTSTERNEVLEANPNLHGIGWRIINNGPTPDDIEQLEKLARVNDIPYDSIHVDTSEYGSSDSSQSDVILEKWNDLENLFGSYMNYPEITSALNLYEQNKGMDAPPDRPPEPSDRFELVSSTGDTSLSVPSMIELDEDECVSILERLPDAYQDRIFRATGVRRRPGANVQDSFNLAAQGIRRTPYYDMMRAAVWDSMGLDRIDPEELRRLICGMIDLIPFENPYVYLSYDHKTLEGAVELRIPLIEFANIVEAAIDGEDDEYGAYASHAKNSQWDYISEYESSMRERMENEDGSELQWLYRKYLPLIEPEEKKIDHRHYKKPKMIDMADLSFKPKDVAMKLVQLMDLHESHRRAEDRLLAEIRRRAGIR